MPKDQEEYSDIEYVLYNRTGLYEQKNEECSWIGDQRLIKRNEIEMFKGCRNK